MKRFIKTNKVAIIKKNNVSVDIFRFVKEGTKRVFFAPEINGQRITKTMYVRLGEAKTLVNIYLKLNVN